MEHCTSIVVRKYVGTAPNYRNSAAELFRHVKCGMREVVLDFSEVEFISRGFADQLHKERLEFQNHCSTQVFIENANVEVQEMMRAVALTQSAIHRERVEIPIFRVKDKEELERMFLAL